MVMSETKEINRNGKRSRGSSPSANNNGSKPPATAPAEDLTPETSDDDSRKHKSIPLSELEKFKFSFQSSRLEKESRQIEERKKRV